MSELETFLETPTPEAVTETAEAPASAEAKTEAKPEAGQGTNSSAEMPAAQKDELTAQTSGKHWTESAYYDEKRKRQELERQLAELKNGPPQQNEEPDLFVDPKGFTEGLKNDIRNTVLNERINLSRELLLETKPDYADKEARFVAMAQADPSLVAKMNASANPAKFAYDTAAKAMEQEAKLKLLDEIGDPVSYKEKLKAELLAELGGQLKQTQKADPLAGKAPSLATASAAAPNTAVTTPSLEELFGGR